MCQTGGDSLDSKLIEILVKDITDKSKRVTYNFSDSHLWLARLVGTHTSFEINLFLYSVTIKRIHDYIQYAYPIFHTFSLVKTFFCESLNRN